MQVENPNEDGLIPVPIGPKPRSAMRCGIKRFAGMNMSGQLEPFKGGKFLKYNMQPPSTFRRYFRKLLSLVNKTRGFNTGLEGFGKTT